MKVWTFEPVVVNIRQGERFREARVIVTLADIELFDGWVTYSSAPGAEDEAKDEAMSRLALRLKRVLSES